VMAATSDWLALRGLTPASHVCWVVDADRDYDDVGAAVLAEAAGTNEKPVVFGPDGRDRHASRFGATIVCAYRTRSFDRTVLNGALCVHPMGVGEDSSTQFKLVAGDDGSWRLSGEVDVAVASQFKTAITTAATAGPCVVDASKLDFLDVSGMRQLAEAARTAGVAVRVIGAPPVVRRA
jgi:anti-anti-sigma factor